MEIKLITVCQHQFRRHRFEWFRRMMGLKTIPKSILDVGGNEGIWQGTGWEKKVTVLNLYKPDRETGLHWVKGDACHMDMFADKSFDLVYSNSVIEHVGSHIQQRLMADGIRRIGLAYWIQTPNRYFPMEPHCVFPCAQFYPRSWRIKIARHWLLSFYRMNGEDPEQMESVDLLSARRLQALFPEAQILREKFMGLTKSLVAFSTFSVAP